MSVVTLIRIVGSAELASSSFSLASVPAAATNTSPFSWLSSRMAISASTMVSGDVAPLLHDEIHMPQALDRHVERFCLAPIHSRR